MKSIRYLSEKIKSCEDEIFLVSLVILVGFLSFGLGRLSKITEQKEPITIEYPLEDVRVNEMSPNIKDLSKTGNFLASKKGKKYYLPWCSGARLISEANIIWFSTIEEAERAGYQKAENCAGL